ncbi:DUF4153 domain-containing protein [Rhodobacter capsulatus]|uniref:DUF4153 domain-containing protein n=1 Tax=Rhodobacter capsulatus TaxID=1061 RepID=UPI004038DC4D
MATAIAAIGLISIVADEDDVEAAQGLILTLSARGLMALVPVLAGLAIWALALRIGQYGWTPERVAASALAVVVAGYGLGYLAALGLGGRWRAALRRVNVAMALAILALAVLWLSPGLSPEAIAVRSQLARFEAGRATVAQLPLWEMKHDWGLAGQRGLERLGARDEAALAERLQQLATAEGRWQFEHAAETGAPALDRLRAAVTLWPAGAAWPEGLAETLAGDLRAPDLGGCAAAAGGGSGRCALVLADLFAASARTGGGFPECGRVFQRRWRAGPAAAGERRLGPGRADRAGRQGHGLGGRDDRGAARGGAGDGLGDGAGAAAGPLAGRHRAVTASGLGVC